MDTYSFVMCVYMNSFILHISYIINNFKKKDKSFTLFITYSIYGITYFNLF